MPLLRYRVSDQSFAVFDTEEDLGAEAAGIPDEEVRFFRTPPVDDAAWTSITTTDTSTPWTPAEFGADAVWIDPMDAAQFTLGAGDVLSGAGDTFSAVSSKGRVLTFDNSVGADGTLPSRVASHASVGGQPIVVINKEECLRSAATTTMPAGATILSVPMRWGASGSGGWVEGDCETIGIRHASSGAYMLANPNSAHLAFDNGRARFEIAPNTGEAYIVALEYPVGGQHDQATAHVDGSSVIQNPVATFPDNTAAGLAGECYLDLGNAAGSNSEMGLAAYIVVARDITADERQKFEGWAAHTFGLTAKLPGVHRYKLDAPHA